MAKKRLTAKQKSIAARKGWVTRRKREMAENAIIPDKEKSYPKIGISSSALLAGMKSPEKTIEQLEAELAEEKKARLEAELRLSQSDKYKDWVRGAEMHNLHRDGTLAMYPSTLRHMGNVTDEMMKQLRKMSRVNKRQLDRQAKIYAEFFDVPLREVYTLFHSP